MKEGDYRFIPFVSSRGKCDKCGNRRNCFMVRLRVPFKADLRLCYICVIDHILRIMKRKERDGRLRAKMLANLEGQTPTSPQADG